MIIWHHDLSSVSGIVRGSLTDREGVSPPYLLPPPTLPPLLSFPFIYIVAIVRRV